MPVDGDLYRKLAGSFPTGVAIVTTRSSDGSPKGLVSIDKNSRALVALRESCGFVINLVKIGAKDVATRYAPWPHEKPAPQVG